MKKKIAIIGSGISGLTAGFLLHRLHVLVQVRDALDPRKAQS